MITKLTIKGVIPGLNGKTGLIREHYRNAKKRKDLYRVLLRGQNPPKHKGKVIIRYIGYDLKFPPDRRVREFQGVGSYHLNVRHPGKRLVQLCDHLIRRGAPGTPGVLRTIRLD